jgi:rod shape-determining protein MreD
MTKKFFISILFFYFLTLFESSFLIHFRFFNKIPSLILTAVVLWNVFEKPKYFTGIFCAFLGGFLWDIFSSHFIGLYALMLLVLAILIKFVIRKYIQPVIRLAFPPIKK